MTSKNFIDKNLISLIDCVEAASDEIMQIYKSDYIGQEEKSDGSPLTIADMKSNEIIIETLKNISADIPVISEENFKEEDLRNLSKTY